MSPPNTVSSYLTLFTLTDHRQTGSGGFVSVVLSLSLRTVAVSDYHTLCCPDFPLGKPSDYLSGSYELYHGMNNLVNGLIRFIVGDDIRRTWDMSK